MFKFKGNIAVIDTETGGLPSKVKTAFDIVALTELALVIIDQNSLEIIYQDSWLIKPYKDTLVYDPGAAAATGIDKAMCEREGVELAVAFKEFSEALSRHNKPRAKLRFAGHNTDFDIPFVANMFKFFKKKIDDYIETKIVIDTLILSHYGFPNAVNHKLGTCCVNAGVDLTNAHRALDDTIATAELMTYFIKGMRGLNTALKEESSVNESTESFKFKL